jgi:autophagy-related protein 9
MLESTNLTGTALGEPKALQYDRALRQSQTLATARQRRGAASTTHPGPSASMFMSQPGSGMSMAQTAILGDSQNSIALQPKVSAVPQQEAEEPEELDESDYIDGKKTNIDVGQSQQEEDDDLEGGGVIGLLAQIYGTRGQGPARVI